MKIRLILSNAKNWALGRSGRKIYRGFFHRTAVKGDTSLGEANYFKNHALVASFYKVIDMDGNVIQSVQAKDTEYAVNQLDENMISLSYEFCGLQGTPLTAKQIAAFVADVKADPYTKGIAKHRLAIAEIVARKVSGWANHHDVTLAYPIPNGHVDGISEKEIAQILKLLG